MYAVAHLMVEICRNFRQIRLTSFPKFGFGIMPVASHLTTLSNYDIHRGLLISRSDQLDLFDDIHTINNTTKDNMLVVEPRSGSTSDEKL